MSSVIQCHENRLGAVIDRDSRRILIFLIAANNTARRTTVTTLTGATTLTSTTIPTNSSTTYLLKDQVQTVKFSAIKRFSQLFLCSVCFRRKNVVYDECSPPNASHIYAIND